MVIGASPNPERFSHKAVRLLLKKGHDVIPVGRRQGSIEGLEIKPFHTVPDRPVHTISIYLAPDKQKEYYDYILSLRPKRVIFNPGTENDELETLLRRQGVETVRYCTLQMLRKGIF